MLVMVLSIKGINIRFPFWAKVNLNGPLACNDVAPLRHTFTNTYLCHR